MMIAARMNQRKAPTARGTREHTTMKGMTSSHQSFPMSVRSSGSRVAQSMRGSEDFGPSEPSLDLQRTSSRASKANSVVVEGELPVKQSGWERLRKSRLPTEDAPVEAADIPKARTSTPTSVKSRMEGSERLTGRSKRSVNSGAGDDAKSVGLSHRSAPQPSLSDVPPLASPSKPIGKPKAPPKPKSINDGVPKMTMWSSIRKRLNAAKEEVLESDNVKDMLFGAVKQLMTKPVDEHTLEYVRREDDPFYVKMTEEERVQRWYDVWWAASRAPRRRQFAATRIQHVWARFLEHQYQVQKASALYIEASFIRYLARRQTRAYWSGFPVSNIPRARMEFILNRIGRPTLGQRSRLERDFQEYLDELKILGETKKYAHRRYRESQMGRSGTVYSFGSNHFGQLGIGDKLPCSYEPKVISTLSGIGIRVVAAAPDARMGYAVSSTGAVYSWGGGGTGPQGIDFDFPVHIPNKGNTWFSKPARVDRQAEDSHSTDPTFFDWHDRWKAPSKEALRELKDKALTLRMQTPHAPDMLELARVFERTLNLDEVPRHFDQWKPRDGLSDDASTVTTVATASRQSERYSHSEAGSHYRPLPENKLMEVRRRGSTMSGQYATTRRNVFSGGDVWLGVGTLTSNAVWVAPSKDHVVVSISEGGALMWGKSVDDCMGPVQETLKQDPDYYNTPSWIQSLSQDFVSHVSSSQFMNCVVTSNGELLSWGKAANFQGAEEATSTHVMTRSDVPLYRWPVFRAVTIHQVCCGPTHAAAISTIGHLYTWGCGSSGVLGHGNTETLRSPRLVRSLSTRVVLTVSCGVNHTAAVVAIPGVSAFVGYENQPFRNKTKMGRWGDLKVQPVNRYSVSLRRLSRATGGTFRSFGGHTARSRGSRPSQPAADRHKVSSQPVTPKSQLSRATSRGRDGKPPIVPENVPAGTATYLKARVRPSSHRSYQADSTRKLTDVPISEHPSVVDVGLPEPPVKPLPAVPPVKQSGPSSGRFAELQRMTRERLESARKSARSGRKRALDQRQKLLNRRGLPPLNNRVVPGTPAGELFTWGTGVFGQLGQGKESSSWLPQPVQWGNQTALGSGLNAAQLEAIGLSLDANGNVDFTSAAVKELLKKPKVTITRTVKEGVITRTVEKDFTGVAPSAAAMEAGIGVQIDAEGLPVDRYRASGIESEIPGWENTVQQRVRSIRHIARKWLLEELTYRDRMEFGVIPGSREVVPDVPPVLVQAVSCGSRHTVCITSRGEVYTFGSDHRGTLGRPLLPTFTHDGTMAKPLSDEEAAALLKAKAKDLLARTKAAREAKIAAGLIHPTVGDPDSDSETATVSGATSVGGPSGSVVTFNDNATMLEATIRAENMKTSSKRVADEQYSKYSWGRDSNMDFNYDLNEASVLQSGSATEDSLRSAVSLTPAQLKRATIDVVAKFAGVLPHELPGNPFQIMTDFPLAVVMYLLTPIELPGVPHKEDDRMMEFERKLLATGEYSELVLARKAFMSLDERQRIGMRPPPRTYTTMPRTTSSHPMPFREHPRFKQGVNSRLVPGLRSVDESGENLIPGPRGKRRPINPVEVVDNMLTNPQRLALDVPLPESFSFPRTYEVAQQDPHFHVPSRVQMFVDPRRRIDATHVTGFMKDFGEGTAGEVAKPLDVLRSEGVFASDSAPHRPQSPSRRPYLQYAPGYISVEHANAAWDLSGAMNPNRRTMDAVMDTLSANSKLTLAPVLTLADGQMVPVEGRGSGPTSLHLQRQSSAPAMSLPTEGRGRYAAGSSHSVTFANNERSLRSPSVGSLSSHSQSTVDASRSHSAEYADEYSHPNASWAHVGLVPVSGGGQRSIPEPERSMYYQGGRNLVPLPVAQGKKYRKVVDPDTLSTVHWDQRFLDRFNADPAKYVYSNTPSDQILRRRAQAAGGRTEGLYMRLDETKIAATRGVDWHGNDVRTLGSQWNQWESGAGTGGGKVRAYKTDEYLHGENLHTSDESQDSEEEVAEERKTLVQKKRDKEKSPGLFPAPDLESWRWTATPGRVVGLVLSGRACSVAAGADFTLVATLSVDYYDTVNDDFDELSSLSDEDRSRADDAVTQGATSSRDRSSRPSLSTYASSEFSDEDEDREITDHDDETDGKSTSSSGTWVTDNGTTDEEAAAAEEDKQIEGYGGEASSDEELGKKMETWIRGMCRICTKCMGFEPAAERLFYCRRCFHHKWLHGERPPVTEKMQAYMAAKIQRRWRARHAKRMMLDVIQQVYQKIRDPASNCFYYFDTRTGQSTWTKPKILGKQDIPETKFSESESEGEEGEEEDGEVGNAETATLGENPAPTTTDVEGESKIEEEGSLGTDATMMDSGLTASSVLSHDPLVMSFGQPN